MLCLVKVSFIYKKYIELLIFFEIVLKMTFMSKYFYNFYDFGSAINLIRKSENYVSGSTMDL